MGSKKRREKLLKASDIFIKIGELEKYCEIMVELNEVVLQCQKFLFFIFLDERMGFFFLWYYQVNIIETNVITVEIDLKITGRTVYVELPHTYTGWN